MLGFLGSQRGNIAIALALSIVGAMAGITMTLLSYKDTIDARYDFDRVQQFLFLRSEAKRGQAIVEKLDFDGTGLSLPVRKITIQGSHTKNTYNLKTNITNENISTGGGIYFSEGYNIKTLAKVNRGTLMNASVFKDESMVRSYAEKGIRRASFAGYHYFTDTDESMNGTPVYFWGPDVIHGKVHSNSDIWLKQGGGGDNSGWPTFYGTVYTTGVIRSYSSNPPYAQVFKSGYFERVGKLEYSPEATAIQNSNNIVGPASPDSNRIVLVTVNGNSYSYQIGTIIIQENDTTDVWTNYPPPQGQYQFHNRFAKIDTVWSTGSGMLMNGSAYVKSQLWLRGNFAGKQTWCSKYDLYLVGSCTLAGTPKGQAPDGGDDGTGPVNHNDFLGIVSEKSIIIKYGFKDPDSGTRVKPNCGSDAEGIWIYAALCALGDGGGNPHKDGIFTFEYQHPHPSATDGYVNDVLYTQIDLHRYKYPQTASLPWPANVDYPWYNPLWPESSAYMERGSIHLYGSVAQKRRGYVHRNTSDGDYPNPDGVWNIPSDFCGGPAYPAGEAYNAPGATGSGVGYKKDYHFDNRFSFTTPPDFPEVHVKGGLTPFDSESWVLKRPPQNM